MIVAHLDGVRLSPPHVELVVAHAEGQDPLVDPQARGEEDEVGRLRVDRLDDELSVVERDVADLGPGEADLGRQLVVLLVDVQSEGVDAEPQFGALLVLDVEVVDSVHLEVLRDLQVLHHGVLSQHAAVLHVPVGDPLFPLLAAELVLLHHALGQQAVVGQEARRVEVLLKNERKLFGSTWMKQSHFQAPPKKDLNSECTSGAFYEEPWHDSTRESIL